MIEIHVEIENIYEDPLDESPDAMAAVFDDDLDVTKVQVEVDSKTPNIAKVTLELIVPDLPDETADEAEWEEWGEDMIQPLTGIGHQEGDSGYFASITEVKHTDYQYAIGKSWEWGV
jgi:hypothetical protein